VSIILPDELKDLFGRQKSIIFYFLQFIPLMLGDKKRKFWLSCGLGKR
jgi:hypothetical protein